MESLTIKTARNETAFAPGESIEGTLSWHHSDQVEHVTVRLFWYTSGRGTRDVEVQEERQLLPQGRSDHISFTFQAPSQPYSFSGELITLSWAIEAIVQPGNRSERLELIIAPEHKEIILSDTPR